MRRWKSCTTLIAALIFGALGCKGNGSSTAGIVLQISPTSTSVVTNLSQQFVAAVTGTADTAVAWSLTCATGVTNCGAIDATTGVYTAPSTIPTTPTATVTATAHADASLARSASITIISAISISVNPRSATIGTGEHATFTASVSNPGCPNPTDPATTCFSVTWSVPTTAGVGSINTTGVYTAPGTVPTTPTVTITATSVTDPTITATATVTIQTANDPTLTSVSPNTAGMGSVFQDIFVTGTNFLATTVAYVNGVPLDSRVVSTLSSSGMVIRLLDLSLTAPGILQITLSKQVGAQQTCAPDATACQVLVTPVRPAVVGPSPESKPQQNVGSLTFNINGGFFGTGGTCNPPSFAGAAPSVFATYDGQVRPSAVNPCNSARQLGVTIGGVANSGDLGTPGLHQVAVSNSIDSSKIAVANLAVQPDININPPTQVTGSPITVGTSPVDVAINAAKGIAVVANSGTNDVTLINLTTSPPTVIALSICTGSLGAASSPCAAVSGPKSVATGTVNINGISTNIALVANGTTKNVAVINLDSVPPSVTALIPLQDSPAGVGINSVTGRALVSMSPPLPLHYGVLLDLTQTTPAVFGIVSISTGPNSRVAVEPHLNWAVATPGGFGSLSIVDLSRQTTNNIVSVSRTAGIVTVTVQASTTATPQAPLAVQQGDAVLIQGISDTTFNGVFYVATVGPGNVTFTYPQAGSPPDVATLAVSGQLKYSGPVLITSVGSSSVSGVGINTETQQAILPDPSTSAVSFFNLLDQTSSSVSLTESGNIAGAFNPLTNIALVVNPTNSLLSVLDPTTPKRIPSSTSVFNAGGVKPVAIAVDPASNLAVVVNQTSNQVSVFTLGAIRPLAVTDTNPKTFELDSTLSTAPTPPAPLTLTILGSGFDGTSQVRLDGSGAGITTHYSPADNHRKLTADIPSGLLSSARRFAVDVQNPGVPPVVSNASDFTVIQSVDVATGTGCASAPLPTGVAIDSQQGTGKGVAVVTLFGCNTVAIVDLKSATGTTVAVGANPIGVAVLSNQHLAVVANNGAGTASVVNYIGAGSVTSTVSTGSGPFGVATDQGTNEAVVTNAVDNTVTLLSVTAASTSVSSTVSTGQRPIAVAFNYLTHEIAVAASAGNSVGIGDPNVSLSANFGVTLPTSVQYDPLTNHFLVNSSITNQLQILDPTTQQQTAFSAGINPTSIAYNYLTSTLVSTNTLSRTLTVVDFLDSTLSSTDRRIRAVLTLPPAPPTSSLALTGVLQFGVDIQPLTNLAVVADTANGKVLFIPLPH